MRRARDGFLLAEALVTLALAGLVLATLAAVLALVLAAGERTAARAEATEVAARLAAALRRDLSGALPIRWAGEDAPFVFDGAPDRVLFAVERGGALVAVELRIDAGETGTRVLRAEAPLLPAATAAADLGLQEREAFVGQVPIGFRFAGPVAPGEPEAATDAWASGPLMPTAVIVDTGGLAERIALAVDAEATCVLEDGPCSLRPQASDDAADADDASDEDELP